MNFKRISNIEFPSGFSCINCSKEIFDDDFLICDTCKKLLVFLSGNLCLHCGNPIPSGNYCLHCKGKKFYCDKIISLFEYDGIVKKFVLNLKYSNKKYYSKSLSKFMAVAFEKEILPCDLITCVPLCDKRLKQRGYNQSELLATHFANHINKPTNFNIIKRIKETPTQTNLNYGERRKNMVGAFKVINKKLVKDKIIVLIDDVYTTGATITECAKTLKDAGAKAVYGVTSAHTILTEEYTNINT